MPSDKPETLRSELPLSRRRPWRTAVALAAAAAAGGALGASTIEVQAPVVYSFPAELAGEELPVSAAEAVAPAPAVEGEPASPEVMQVMSEGPATWVLLHAAADQTWLGGKPVVAVASDDSMWLERSVTLDRGALPAELQAWTGRELAVVDRDGNRCSATIDDVTGRQFAYTDGDAKVGTVVEGNWYRTAIVGKLTIDSAGCGEPLYALAGVDQGRPGPTTLRYGAVSPARGKLARRARRLFRKLPAYQRLQAEWQGDSYGGTGAWDHGDGSHDVFSIRLGDQRFVLVAGRGAGCGGPDGELVALWRVRNSDTLGELVMQRAASLYDVRAVFDADADGLPDFIVGQDLATATLRSAAGAYELEKGFEIDHDFCRC